MTSESTPALAVRDLQVDYLTQRGVIRSLDSATLSVGAGEIVAVVGESGSGKSTLGMAAGRLLAANARYVGGTVAVDGVSLVDSPPEVVQQVRRDSLGFIFQNPVAALDPTLRVGRQLQLVTGGAGEIGSAEEQLRAVGLPDVERVLRSYPHELSGGMAQRVGIALALRRHPRLLVADEPTSAVDATLRGQILRLLVDRCRQTGCALLLLTHDLHAVAEYCSRIAVMYGGRVVESGATAEVLATPAHPYTRALISSLPGEEQPGRRLDAESGTPPVLHAASPGCAYVGLCRDARAVCADRRPAATNTDRRTIYCHLFDPAHTSSPHITGRPRVVDIRIGRQAAMAKSATARATVQGEAPAVTSVRDVVVEFSGRGRRHAPVAALREVSLDIEPGETVGVVGESGSGKTTLGRVILGLVRPTSGGVLFDGRSVIGRRAARRLVGRRQVVLQNPDWSLNPTLRIGTVLAEPLVVGKSVTRRQRHDAVETMLEQVGLDRSLAARRPHELSGGQRQRVAIARALITRPDLIVFDEAVTALDASVQTQVLNLIHDIQQTHGFAALFISHDIAAVRYVSHRIAVMYRGEIVECGPAERFYGTPEHSYSKQLLAAVPTLSLHRGDQRVRDETRHLG